MEDLDHKHKVMKEEYEALINRERELMDKIKAMRDLREKIKNKQVAVAQLEKELAQLL